MLWCLSQVITNQNSMGKPHTCYGVCLKSLLIRMGKPHMLWCLSQVITNQNGQASHMLWCLSQVITNQNGQASHMLWCLSQVITNQNSMAKPHTCYGVCLKSLLTRIAWPSLTHAMVSVSSHY